MGNNESACFGGPFDSLAPVTFEQVQHYVKRYKELDLDFGIDQNTLEFLLGFDKGRCEGMVTAMDHGSGVVNALDFLLGMGMCCAGPLQEKIILAFEMYDFDKKGRITMDEMIIAVISALVGLTVMSRTGKTVNEPHVERLVATMYEESGRAETSSISRGEFVQWCLNRVEADEEGVVSLDEVLTKFGLSESVGGGGAGGADVLAVGGEGEVKDMDADTEFAIPIPEEYPEFPESCDSLLKSHLTRGVFSSVKESLTPAGTSLWNVIKGGIQDPTHKVGVLAGDAESYSEFAPLLDPILQGIHVGYRLDDPDAIVERDFEPDSLRDANTDCDPEKRFVKSVRCRVSRNMSGFPFAIKHSPESRGAVENKIVETLALLKGQLEGSYWPLKELDAEARDALEKAHHLWPKRKGFYGFAGMWQDYPENRGVYLNSARDLGVWVNREDHLEVFTMREGAQLASTFRLLHKTMTILDKKLSYAYDDQRGFLASSPGNCGTGFRVSALVKLPHSVKDDRFKELCSDLTIEVRGANGEGSEPDEDGHVDLSPSRRLGLTEVEAIEALHEAILRAIILEKELEATWAEEERKRQALAEREEEDRKILAEMRAKKEGKSESKGAEEG